MVMMISWRRASLILLGILIFGSLGVFVVNVLEATVCCEKTNSGMFCQDVPAESCASDRQPPTSCESTFFCKSGWCYDSEQGTCLDNTPQITCNENGGTWTEEKPPVCNLGCCVLDDQASFVTLTRCKALSGYAGIETQWDSSITDEVQCILTAGTKEKGACVYEEDFTRTCKFTTRDNCNENVLGGGVLGEQEQDLAGSSGTGDLLPNAGGGASNNSRSSVGGGAPAGILAVVSAQGEVSERALPAGCQLTASGVFFCPGKLCSSEELETNCAKTKNTICNEGKEEVYYVMQGK
jgi:hypothetical protein